MIPRCIQCHHRIWPWRHFGLRVWADGTEYWHSPPCTVEERS